MSQSRIDFKAYIAYATVCIAWGATYLAIRIGVQDVPPLLFGGPRFIIAGLILLAVVLTTGRKLPSTWTELRTVVIVGVLLLFGANGLVLWAEQFIPSGITSLIVCATPMFVAVFDYLAPGGERMGWRGWLGLLIGFAGIAWLVAPANDGGNLDLAGVAALIGACIFWATGTVYSSRRPVNASMLAVAALEMLAAGIAMCLAGLLKGDLAAVNLTSRAVGAMAFLTVIGSIIGYSAFVYIMDVMPPSRAQTYTYINPIVAVILGAAVLQEKITAGGLGAMAIILTGVIMTHTARFKTAASVPDVLPAIEGADSQNWHSELAVEESTLILAPADD